MEYRKEVLLQNRLGLHVRPATLLAQKASSFKSEVFLERNGNRVNVKSCIELLTLGALPGSRLTLIAVGSDAKDAVDSISKMFETNFKEGEKK